MSTSIVPLSDVMRFILQHEPICNHKDLALPEFRLVFLVSLWKGFGGLVVYRPIQQEVAACMSPVEVLETGIRMESSDQREELIKKSSDWLINDTGYYLCPINHCKSRALEVNDLLIVHSFPQSKLLTTDANTTTGNI